MNTQTKIVEWFKRNSFPILAFLISRLGLFVLVYISLVVLPMRTGDGLWRAFPQNLFLDGWSRWDSNWYINIAQHGYSDTIHNVYLNTAFFPLYPLLIKGLSALVGNVHIAGLLISNTSLLAASLVLYRLVSDKFDTEIAQKSLLLLLVNPFSFFFSSVYTESLFLMLVALVFYFGTGKKWVPAVLCVAAAGATRLVGILTVIPLLYFYFESIEFKWRKVRADILWFGLSVVGIGGFILFQAFKFGDPFLFVKSQNAPGWKEGVDIFSALDALRISFSGNALKTGEFPGVYLVHILAFLVGLSILIVCRRKLHPAWWIWALLTLLISFSVWISVGRFLIVIFPLYVGTALLFKGKCFDAVLYVSVLFLSLFTILFSHWYWVG
ncbi:MAG: hypothetical protein C0410_08080 [Anaerolinea sp.]|nr:hypothetical protein [Anaerolinea sp.]